MSLINPGHPPHACPPWDRGGCPAEASLWAMFISRSERIASLLCCDLFELTTSRNHSAGQSLRAPGGQAWLHVLGWPGDHPRPNRNFASRHRQRAPLVLRPKGTAHTSPARGTTCRVKAGQSLRPAGTPHAGRVGRIGKLAPTQNHRIMTSGTIGRKVARSRHRWRISSSARMPWWRASSC